jgi:cytochrome c-type biogenesis protein CcmH/NrfF
VPLLVLGLALWFVIRRRRRKRTTTSHLDKDKTKGN